MNNSRRLSTLFLPLAFSLAFFWVLASPAFATEWVSAARHNLRMRAGPGTDHPARWTVGKGYPFKVLARNGRWLKVTDFEHDSGWIYGPMTTSTPHVIVRASSANLRSAPNGSSAVVHQAVNGDVLRKLRRRGRWLQVRHARGAVGWVVGSRVWGW